MSESSESPKAACPVGPVASKVTGGLFMLSGGVKLFKISDDLHKELKRSFKDYASVFPLAPVGLVPDHKMYKHVWGAAEVACGSMIVFGKNKNKRKGCVALLVLLALQTQAKLCLGEYLGALLPACVGAAVGGLYLFLKVEDIQGKKAKAEEKEEGEGKDE